MPEAVPMPRTPLFASLRRLAHDAAASDPQPAGLSRRTFITGAAALPTALALGRLPPAARAAAAGRHIAVVGGGISGLVAALTLHDIGLVPVVFEANSRYGGRIHTNRAGWFGDQVAEWCGELIDTSHVTMIGLAKRFGLPLTDVLAAVPRGAQYTLAFDGTYYPIAQAARDFKPVYAALTAQLRAAGDLAPYDAIVARPTGGYVVTAANDAAVSAFSGDALLSGGPGVALSATLVGTAVTPTGKGTWQVSLDGGIFTSGDAKFYGSLPGDDLRPEAPVTGIAGSPDGHGYWLVGADGTVYPFGDARFFGMAFQ